VQESNPRIAGALPVGRIGPKPWQPELRMNIAVNHLRSPEQVARANALGRLNIARIEVFDTLVGAEPFWRRLENGGALATAYQRFDLLAAWQLHVGSRSEVTPFIVVGFGADGEPLFLWPFGHMRKGPLTLMGFLGSKHSNFNTGLWRRDILPTIGENDIRPILHGFKDYVDVVVLCNQPLSWEGASNPFALLSHQPSPDISACLSLPQSATQPINAVLSRSMRSRLRNKERRLQKLPGYRYIKADAAGDIDRLFDGFLALKRDHMAAQGLCNVFAEPGVADFLRAACHCRLANGRPLIEIHALEGAGEVLALFGTLTDSYRCSSMFNTYTFGENARQSPGLILLGYMINECSARGVHSFDIGVGRAHYKSLFCREPEPLFDTFLGLTVRGHLAARAYAAAFSGKRAIKRSRLLWGAVQLLRRARARG
jgi:CelD/BcsL family acetyltransferase involved in cellulose biosynthesis